MSTSPLSRSDSVYSLRDNPTPNAQREDYVSLYRTPPSSPKAVGGRSFDYKGSLSREEVAKVLAQSPYNPRKHGELPEGSPGLLGRVSRLAPYSPECQQPSDFRKKHLTRMRKSLGREKPRVVMGSPYGRGPLSRKAAAMKRKAGATTGRNAAIIIFKHAGQYRYVEGLTEGPPGGHHAEFKSLTRAILQRVHLLYTERHPCLEGLPGTQCCHARLSALLPADAIIVASTVEPSKDPEIRARQEDELRQAQEALGVKKGSSRRKRARGKENVSVVKGASRKKPRMKGKSDHSVFPELASSPLSCASEESMDFSMSPCLSEGGVDMGGFFSPPRRRSMIDVTAQPQLFT
jgi:hypothetical protein